MHFEYLGLKRAAIYCEIGSGGLQGTAGLGDYPRVAVACAVDLSSPYLLEWQKDPTGEPVTFDGPPCSFPGQFFKILISC